MAKITYISGGARSGKSTYAEDIALKEQDGVLYVATAIPFDSGMEDRIEKHKDRRPSEWGTLEAYKGFKKHLSHVEKTYKCILFDCVTVMVTNLMLGDPSIDWDQISHLEIDDIEEKINIEISELLATVREQDIHLVIVSNELGMGIVPENRLARIFRDIAGRINQKIANEADEAYFIVSGQALKLK